LLSKQLLDIEVEKYTIYEALKDAAVLYVGSTFQVGAGRSLTAAISIGGGVRLLVARHQAFTRFTPRRQRVVPEAENS
jgi:hypothetical protein